MTEFEPSPGLSWEDSDERFLVVHGARTLYYGPDESTARSVAQFAERFYGRRFRVEAQHLGRVPLRVIAERRPAPRPSHPPSSRP